MNPSPETLSKLQQGEIDLGGVEEAVQRMVDPRLLAYNDTWDKIDAMLDEVMSESFRRRTLDSRGRGWVYNWFCVDHIDYDVNPRRRDIGYHNVFDHYVRKTRNRGGRDGVHFHFHPHHPTLSHAHRSGTHWFANSSKLFQVLARRVIDRGWFPAANRPGFNVTRPDSHWFLEQYLPFDFANQAVESEEDSANREGLWGDWRRAPRTWTPYHPSHDDYQTPGECRRWIARCLSVGVLTNNLPEAEVRRAFEEAQAGDPVVLAFTDHDYRDIGRDVNYVRELLERVSRDYPEVDYVYSEAVEAMRSALDLPSAPPCNLTLELEASGDRESRLRVYSDVPTFGPQPFMALKTKTGQYYHENLIVETPHHEWTYILDPQTVSRDGVEKIGVAANNECGVTTVAVLDVSTGKVEHTYWNVGTEEGE